MISKSDGSGIQIEVFHDPRLNCMVVAGSDVVGCIAPAPGAEVGEFRIPWSHGWGTKTITSLDDAGSRLFEADHDGESGNCYVRADEAELVLCRSHYVSAADPSVDLEAAVCELLERHGVCVVEDVFDTSEVAAGIDFVWEHLEARCDGLVRGDVRTWDRVTGDGDDHLFKPHGVTAAYGVAQSKAAWSVRGHPMVQRLFCALWGEARAEHMITSMDSLFLWRQVGRGLWLTLTY
jgi:hypothetical protein